MIVIGSLYECFKLSYEKVLKILLLLLCLALLVPFNVTLYVFNSCLLLSFKIVSLFEILKFKLDILSFPNQ